jgi:hypothetical protein
MLDGIPWLFALAGFAGGLYLACRFAWPRKIYTRIFGGSG